MSIVYKGQPGKVIAETSLEGHWMVTFIIKLNDGTIKEVPMYEVEIPYVSVLEQVKRAAA
jgi:hypothetical protein